MQLPTAFKNLRIRYKLLAGYTTVFLLVTLLAGVTIYSSLKDAIERDILERLNSATSNIVSMVETAADVSIKNNLRAAARRSKEMVEGVYDLYESGFISERWAKWMAERLLLGEVIGKTGYVYVLNSDGRVIIHPQPGVWLANVIEHDFVRRQTREKVGYIEYDWQNPDEEQPRPKALYMDYFEPWDWIISASSYREEFAELVNVDDFRDEILGLRIGESGYSFLLTAEGKALVHPSREGENLLRTGSPESGVISEMIRMKSGTLEYEWRNPGESRMRHKMVLFTHLPEYGWIVASSVYLEEAYSVLDKVRTIIIAVSLAALALFVLVTMMISKSITTPLANLTDRLDKGAGGDFSVRVEEGPEDEVGRLGRYFNQFMDRLDAYRNDLHEQVEERRRSEERYKLAVEHTNEAIVVVKDDAQVFFNERYKSMTGYDDGEIRSARASDFIHEGDRESVRQLRQAQLDRPPAPHALVFRMLDKQGEVVWVQVNEVRIDWEGEPAILSFQTDITIRKQVEDSLSRQKAYFTQLFENSPQAIALLSGDGTFLDGNRAFEVLFGYSREEVAEGMANIVPEGLAPEVESMRAKCLDGESVFVESRRQHKDGSQIPVSILGYPFRIKGENAGAFFVFNDISERKLYERKLTHLALHDSLTGLPNRTLFMERLGRAMSRRMRREEYRFAVMMVDLDRFKQVNDTMGHQVGDKLLVEVGARIAGCVREMDTVARLGGDEFAVILEEFHSRAEVITIVERILGEIERPMDVDGNIVRTTASTGVVLETAEYSAPENILRDADISMYKSKEQGKNSYRIFTPAMHEETVEAATMEREMREAIPGGEFFLEFQPIQSLRMGRMVGFEALVRWNHPRRGLLGPAQFIPLAEDSGLITSLGQWVLSEACATLAGWRKNLEGAKDLAVSVNISAKQLSQTNLVDYVAEVLEENGLPPSSLRLEITETSLTENTEAVLTILKRFKELGVQLSIDDFGTGYSSLSYLQQFPVDTLKVDRSFISRIQSNPEDMEIVRAVVLLAHSLGMEVVAEGVELPEQLSAVEGLHCEFVQGFYFSRPLNADKMREIINGMD